MEFVNQIFFPDRENWRDWLQKNHTSEKEAWMIFYKKHTEKTGVSYEAAVEEALCFGWIDGMVRRIDEERYMQRFTPRNSSSKWSNDNIQRVKKLIGLKRMTPAGLVKYQEVINHPERLVIINKPVDEIKIPDDLLTVLAQVPMVLEKFTHFSLAYKHLCIRWIDAAKKPETRVKRIREVADLTAKGGKLGLK